MARNGRVGRWWMALVLGCCMGVGLPAPAVRADAGPKPTMEFRFLYETAEPLTIVEGTLFECDEIDCSDAMALEVAGPQNFSCDAQACSSMAYGYDDYHRIAIRFSDGQTRESNIFTGGGFNTHYVVTVRAEMLFVEAEPWYRTPWGIFFSGGLVVTFAVCGLGALWLVGIVLLLVRWVRRARA